MCCKERKKKLRDILQEAGFRCNVEPQILSRLANETCQFSKPGFLGEIYVHQAPIPPTTLPSELILASIAVLVMAIIITWWIARKH